MKFEESVIKWMRSLYTTQTAQITVNDKWTRSCSKHKRTTQGSPFLPLLFILVLEILNR